MTGRDGSKEAAQDAAVSDATSPGGLAALPLAADALGLPDEADVDAFWQRWSAWHAQASANSARSMRTGMKRYASWCAEAGYPLLPASPVAMVAYLRALEADGLRPASIDNRVSAVSLLHGLAGHGSPTADRLVRLELRRIRKALGTAQKQAAALRAKGDIEDLEGGAPDGLCVETLVAVALADAERLEGDDRPSVRARRLVRLRDAAMLSLAYDGGLRASEVVAARTEHLAPAPGGAGTLRLPASKTDQTGEGADVAVSPASIRLIACWHGALASLHQDPPGPLFVRVSGSGFATSDALSEAAVTDSFRRLARAALRAQSGGAPLTVEQERQVAAFSSHSGRVGAAQDAVALGEADAGIMQAYRWRSVTMVRRYTSRVRAQTNTGARVQKVLRG